MSEDGHKKEGKQKDWWVLTLPGDVFVAGFDTKTAADFDIRERNQKAEGLGIQTRYMAKAQEG